MLWNNYKFLENSRVQKLGDRFDDSGKYTPEFHRILYVVTFSFKRWNLIIIQIN